MRPTGTHIDWPWPFRLISRRLTSFDGPPPIKLAGNADLRAVTYKGELCFYAKPIPDRGQWWFGWPFYFALQTKGGWYFRIGARWDDVDQYYAVPSFTIKRYK